MLHIWRKITLRRVTKKLVKGKIDEDRKCLAELYIKAWRHTSSAELQTAAAHGGRGGQKPRKVWRKKTQNKIGE